MPEQNDQTKLLVRLYTRPGCHLCEEAKAEIARAGCAGLFLLEEVNIDCDGELRMRFGWDIPVIEVGGAVVFKHRLTAEEFRREIERARGRV
jgi:exo-beta-1,3-glucanase (GH17 family)